MYLIGFNSIRFPWAIPKDFPRDALKKQDREKLISFIDDYNAQLRFAWWEALAFLLVKVLFPPAAQAVHLHFRKKKFRNLQSALYNHFLP